jgi:hypothetical protein
MAVRPRELCDVGMSLGSVIAGVAIAVGQRRLLRPEIRTRSRPCTGEYQGVITIGNAGARTLGPPLLYYLRLGLARTCWIIVGLILFAPGLATSIAAHHWPPPNTVAARHSPMDGRRRAGGPAR